MHVHGMPEACSMLSMPGVHVTRSDSCTLLCALHGGQRVAHLLHHSSMHHAASQCAALHAGGTPGIASSLPAPQPHASCSIMQQTEAVCCAQAARLSSRPGASARSRRRSRRASARRCSSCTTSGRTPSSCPCRSMAACWRCGAARRPLTCAFEVWVTGSVCSSALLNMMQRKGSTCWHH